MKSNIEQAIEAITQLLTATRDHGSWKPNIVISYLGENEAAGYPWYVSLTEYKRGYNDLVRHLSAGGSEEGTPVKTVIFKGTFETLREGLKAAAEFLAPTKLDAMKARVQALAEKL